MESDKVSIIIVTFNAAATLQQAIDSVAQQDYNNLELVIVDGGSTDETVEIIKKNQEFVARWVSENDKGIYDAMNKGARLATGKWLLFLGADDKLCPCILNNIFQGQDYKSADLLYGKIDLDGTGKLLGQESDYERMIAFNIPHQAIFYNKDLLNKLGGYNLSYKILADYDLNLKIFQDPLVRTIFLDKAVAIFCSRGISNRTIDLKFFKDKLHHFVSKDGLSKNDKRLAKYYFFIGLAMVLQRQYYDGAKRIVHPVIFGGERFYYFLLTGNFVLTLLGIGRKYKYVIAD